MSTGAGGGGLSAEDLELMALLLEEAGIESAAPDSIRPRPPGARVPLTFSQKRLWFLEQLEPETRIYNDVFAVRLVGELDAAALDAAIRGVAERHESLRTVFVEEEGEPWQVVLPEPPFRLDVRDLAGLPEGERMPAVRRIADEVTYVPFDLARGPLLRPTLLRLAERDHALLLPVHHIVTDGWSQGVFWREMMALYGAAREGRPSPLPPPPLQYGDFAVWQREHLAGGALERQLDYWKERLRGAPTLLGLPTDRPRPAEQTYRGAGYDFAVPETLAAGIGALAQQEGATLFMALLAALGALFGRYAGEDDVVVGSPIASRTRPELEDVVGLFANTLAIRVDLAGDPTFRELLRRVRDGVFEDFANQDLPFEKIVEELRLERSLAYNPVYQVLLVLQNAPRADDGAFTGLAIHPLRVDHRKSKLDLAMTLVGTERGMFGGWEYSTELFERETIVRLTDHFFILLAGIVEDPDRRLSGLPLIHPEERARVLGWSRGSPDEPAGEPVHLGVERRAERTPDALAVESAEGSLTCAELVRRGRRLAAYLRARGVGPETRVAVYVERSPEMVVALLGVLGAGGAYVPLDPQSPRDRLALLVEDSAPAVILTRERSFAELPGSAAADTVFLDADRERIDAEADAPFAAAHPESAAYVVYTSGSTGKPKGVVVSHGSLAGFVAAAVRAYGIGAEDRVLQFASIAFDASAEEIWPALVTGARLVLRTEEMLGSARLFLDACREREISVLDLPTAYWHELVTELAEGGGADLPGSLRLTIIGGERALPERLRAWREAFGGRVRLVNSYGPTEATVVATLCDLADPDGDPAASSPRHVPIGRPLGHARAYVLDPRGDPAPIGIPGELYLGGGGVARGYLDRPALTAEKFVPDPFGAGPGGRLYRTGDRVRWLADGTLEFLGRTDQQVKVRGFRVEPGEVEAALAAQPGVEEAAVVAREDGSGQARLVAYVVPEAGAELSVGALRAALKLELPPYMVPAAWVTLPAMPLTRSGKTDRRALPAPESAPAAREAGEAAPQSDVERAVAAAWQEVLGVEEVGLDDNFFDLGGHSLLLARLRSRLAGRFPRDVSVVVLFRYPTVRSLAEYLAQGEAAPEAAAPSHEEVEDRRAAMRRRRELRREA